MNDDTSDSEFISQLKAKANYYEDQINSGIFFKLEPGKEPSEILGVLDVLKYKFKKWQQATIFSYCGDLFSGNTVLIVGTKNLEEARNILHFVYFKELIKSETQISVVKSQSILQLELFLEEEFKKNVKVGYPTNREMEKEIHTHLTSLIDDHP